MKRKKMNRKLKLTIAALSCFSALGVAAMTAPNALADSTVTVQPGDTLWKIANITHTSVAALEQANPGVSPENLQAGTVLRMPDEYTVQSGDSLWLIARKYGITVNQLEAANPGVGAANLTIGRVLWIPGGTTASSASAPSYSSTDLYWMEHIIHAEAGNQSMDAKIAVGDVILNRVQSSSYPNTVKGVIFQVSDGHYQFTPVLNGYINSTPASADDTAALQVLAEHVNLVPGALVFYTPSQTPASSWVRKQPTVASFGDLTFAK